MGPNLLYKFILSVMFVVSMRRELNFLNRMLQLKLENNDLLLFITMFCSLEGKVRMKKIYFCTCSFPEIKNLNKNSIFYLLSSRRQSSNDFFISSFPDGRNLIKNNSVFFPRSLLECKVQKHFCTWSFKKKREGVLPSPSQKAKFKWNQFFPRSFPWNHSPDKKKICFNLLPHRSPSSEDNIGISSQAYRACSRGRDGLPLPGLR